MLAQSTTVPRSARVTFLLGLVGRTLYGTLHRSRERRLAVLTTMDMWGMLEAGAQHFAGGVSPSPVPWELASFSASPLAPLHTRGTSLQACPRLVAVVLRVHSAEPLGMLNSSHVAGMQPEGRGSRTFLFTAVSSFSFAV